MYTKPEACLQFKSRIKGKEAKREAKYTLGKTTNSIELDPQFSLWVWTVGYFGNRNPKKKKKALTGWSQVTYTPPLHKTCLPLVHKERFTSSR